MSRFFTEISYVYFIHHKGDLIYIGRSQNPLVRVANHRNRFLKRKNDYSLTIFGPYDKWTALTKEATETHKIKDSSKLLSSVKYKHGNYQKIPVKNNERKIILHFGKGGKIKKVVCKHFDKQYFRGKFEKS